MNAEIEKQIGKLQHEIDKLKIIAAEQGVPKEGEWWTFKDVWQSGGRYCKLALIKGSCYVSVDGYHFNNTANTPVRKATESEVREAFTKEWERRGAVKGCKFKGIYGGDFTYSGEAYIGHTGCLVSKGGGVIFEPNYNERGSEWADIIKEEKIMIGDSEVKFKKGAVEINGYNFSENGIEALSIALPELFGKILKRMEQ